MKVLLVNGSPREKGCTYTALCEVAGALEEAGMETEIFWIGSKPIQQCTACHRCTELGRCVFDDVVNRFLLLAEKADGFVYGAPVHFAGAAGGMVNFMGRLYYSATRQGAGPFRLKPAASISSARRAGTTVTLDQMNRYFLYAEEPVVGSCYWNQVHGDTPDQVRKDLEGLQTMRVLGRNMAWLLRAIDRAKEEGLALPEKEQKIWTNFIR